MKGWKLATELNGLPQKMIEEFSLSLEAGGSRNLGRRGSYHLPTHRSFGHSSQLAGNKVATKPRYCLVGFCSSHNSDLCHLSSF